MSNPIDNDIKTLKELKKLIQNSDSISSMNEKEINDKILYCMKQLNKFTMGGRSACLIALSLLLWKSDRSCVSLPDIDFEPLLSMSFRITTDPSFIFPEWGIILAGVIIAKYSDCFPKDSLDDILKQCKLLLQHLKNKSGLHDAIRITAEALLASWENNFCEGLNPLVKTSLAAWPDTSDCKDINTEELREQLVKLSKRTLSADLNISERRLYKLLLEKEGEWKQFELLNMK